MGNKANPIGPRVGISINWRDQRVVRGDNEGRRVVHNNQWIERIVRDTLAANRILVSDLIIERQRKQISTLPESASVDIWRGSVNAVVEGGIHPRLEIIEKGEDTEVIVVKGQISMMAMRRAWMRQGRKIGSQWLKQGEQWKRVAELNLLGGKSRLRTGEHQIAIRKASWNTKGIGLDSIMNLIESVIKLTQPQARVIFQLERIDTPIHSVNMIADWAAKSLWDSRGAKLSADKDILEVLTERPIRTDREETQEYRDIDTNIEALESRLTRGVSQRDSGDIIRRPLMIEKTGKTETNKVGIEGMPISQYQIKNKINKNKGAAMVERIIREVKGEEEESREGETINSKNVYIEAIDMKGNRVREELFKGTSRETRAKLMRGEQLYLTVSRISKKSITRKR